MSGASLNRVTSLPLRLPTVESSFFFDTVLEYDLEVLPQPASAAVAGSKQKIRIVVEAPLKRLLLYLALGLSAILGCVLFLRAMFGRPSGNQAAGADA